VYFQVHPSWLHSTAGSIVCTTQRIFAYFDSLLRTYYCFFLSLLPNHLNNATSSTVIAVDPMNGSEILTASVAGTAVGTPVTTADGTQILLTTNPTLNTGLFTVINIADPSVPALSYPIDEGRVSAIGPYWNPVQG